MAFFESLRLKEFGFGSSIRNTSATSSTMSLCSKHKAEGSKIKSYPKMEGLVELMLKPVQTYKLPRSSVNEMPNSFELILLRTKKNFWKNVWKEINKAIIKNICALSHALEFSIFEGALAQTFYALFFLLLLFVVLISLELES